MTWKEKINQAKIDEKVDLGHHKIRYESVKFDYCNFGFSWIAYLKAAIWIPILPMKSNTEVKFYKTLNSAKLGFIRRVQKGVPQ